MLKIIEEKLRAALAPDSLEVIDESHLHIGHAGSRPGAHTHVRVKIVSRRFDGMNRVARQRVVYDLLAAELADTNGVHALAIEAKGASDARP